MITECNVVARRLRRRLPHWEHDEIVAELWIAATENGVPPRAVYRRLFDEHEDRHELLPRHARRRREASGSPIPKIRMDSEVSADGDSSIIGDSADSSHDPGEFDICPEDRAKLQFMLGLLEPKRRAVAELYIRGLDKHQIAASLNMNPSTVGFFVEHIIPRDMGADAGAA